ncbi:MAG TPA: ATP-binding protein [Solirubrobacteraceae bacterium]|nr:ATP-binding protein [Solirubrobacteraceae bacterium]
MRTFPAIPQSVHAARRFATDTLSGIPSSILEAVELMVSELATNCIRHERASFHIAILGSSREIRVEVTDSGTGTPTMRSPGPNDPSGRGLQIVDMLSASWGVKPERPAGKTVWFTVPSATGERVSSEGENSRERVGAGAMPVGGTPSTVHCLGWTPNGPTSQCRCGTTSHRSPSQGRRRRANSQGRSIGRRYSQHDEPGSHARSRGNVGRLA